MITEAGSLRPSDAEVLHRLVADWQVLSDVAFGDVILLMRSSGGHPIIAAHARPATAAPVFREDMIGAKVPEELVSIFQEVFQSHSQATHATSDTCFQLTPICKGERIIAVLVIVQHIAENREPLAAKQAYHTITTSLLEMITEGTFPHDNAVTWVGHGTPRVADGLILLDEHGVAHYLSPNAVSAFHRLGAYGPLLGSVLAETVTALYPDMVDETLAVVIMGKAPWITEISSRGVTVALRAIPIIRDGAHVGAALLCRDITEIRRHEEDIHTKNATIREIHHRVKNNLQTVSALLRLQSRRSSSPEVKQTLTEAGRRVATIALVHETLSQTVNESVDFDEVFERLIRMAADVASPGQKIATKFIGTFGKIAGSVATTIAIVINELVTNAVEHGLCDRSGTVTVTALREGVSLKVEVHDDGTGLDTSMIHKGLGTQIVSTMVRSEINGSIEWNNDPNGGTVVHVVGRLDKTPR